MVQSNLTVHGNIAILDIITNFNWRYFLHFFKKNGECFKLSYTAIDSIIILKGQIKCIWPDRYVEVHTLEGTKRAHFFENLDFGDPVFLIERFTINKKQYPWTAIRSIPQDVNCISVNVDVYGQGKIMKRFMIDPYLGSYVVVQ